LKGKIGLRTQAMEKYLSKITFIQERRHNLGEIKLKMIIEF
jgi:hypothetical protein